MASVSPSSLSRPISPFYSSSHPSSSLSSLQFQFPSSISQTQFRNPAISCFSSVVKFNKHSFSGSTKVRASAEEGEAIVPEAGEAIAAEEETQPPSATDAPDQTVSVSVSPSGRLTMFFQAEGTMPDSAIPRVTKALEEVEGITDLKVQVLEGIASVELAKQTTIQATGVASNLVEIIQGAGFKLQTLNLSFQDEEDLS